LPTPCDPDTAPWWTVHEAVIEYLESAAIHAYRRWDADAPEYERAALEALAAQDDRSLPFE
jgi:hypothetical protein